MKLGKLTSSVLIGVSISLSVSCDLIICASAAFAQVDRSLSVADVEKLLKGGVSDGRIAQLIQQYGVNFEATATVRTRLKNAGAGAGVMQAAEKASVAYAKARKGVQPAEPAADSERTKQEKENRKLQETLERGEALKIAPPQAPLQKRSDGAEMVSIPAGEFWMGSEDADASFDEKLRRRVYLDAFQIDKFEVTNALYRKFMEATNRESPQYWYDSKWNGLQQPVVGVSWDDAWAYCSWAGKRLPTEAEWEKAARGTDGRKYPWGEQWDSSRANSSETKIGKTVAVGSYSGGVSPYGVHDVAGNVWEWVEDWYDEGLYQHSPDHNPKGSESGQQRVVRGGSWYLNARYSRTSGRLKYLPSARFFTIGFRCGQ